jgi:transcriptional regulator with XRE-family HTH domain
MPDFDMNALYEALDAEREARGLTWADVLRQLNERFERLPSRPFAMSTIKGMREKRSVTSAVVLQLLRWLRRAPEDFIPDGVPLTASTALPTIPDTQVLRFDTKALHAALNAARIERGLTWSDVAARLSDTQAPMLTGLAKGPLIGFPQVTRITQWLGVPAATFVRGYDW